MPSFADIQTEAKRRWDALSNGDRPWIRVSTAICGEAAGAKATVHAFESQLAAFKVLKLFLSILNVQF